MSKQKGCYQPKPKEPWWCGSGKQYRTCCLSADKEIIKAQKNSKYEQVLTFSGKN